MKPPLGSVSRILVGGVAEPNLDRGDVDGASEDKLSFVGAHRDRAELLEPADGALDGVALLVGLGVERRWSSAARPLAGAGLLLVGLLRTGRNDPASPQLNSDLAGGVGLVGQRPVRSGPRPARTTAAQLQPLQQRGKGQRVVALPGGGDPRQRPAPVVGEQVDFRAQPAPRPSQALPILDQPRRLRGFG